MKKTSSGFTLIETMVAISLLMLALIAPMSLAAESLTAAYYSRSQITAFYLAQEGIEVVRSVRDANILAIAEGNPNAVVFGGIPYGTSLATAQNFTVNALTSTAYALTTCASGGCPLLQTNGVVYGYSPSCASASGIWQTTDCPAGNGWTDTTFTRTLKAYLVSTGNSNELRVSVNVTWRQGSLQTQHFSINEDLYAWVSPGSGGGTNESDGSSCSQNAQCTSGVCGNGICQAGL